MWRRHLRLGSNVRQADPLRWASWSSGMQRFAERLRRWRSWLAANSGCVANLSLRLFARRSASVAHNWRICADAHVVVGACNRRCNSRRPEAGTRFFAPPFCSARRIKSYVVCSRGYVQISGAIRGRLRHGILPHLLRTSRSSCRNGFARRQLTSIEFASGRVSNAGRWLSDSELSSPIPERTRHALKALVRCAPLESRPCVIRTNAVSSTI